MPVTCPRNKKHKTGLRTIAPYLLDRHAELKEHILDKRIHIITGHYGSGKSEISVNLAIELSKKEKNIVFADLDIINPYFRSNEARGILENHGISVLTTKYANTNVDVPALTGELSMYLNNKAKTIIMDIGGDDAGARVVGRYKNEIPPDDAIMYFVVNCYRPETKSVDGVLKVLDEIREASGMNIGAIINNGHLMDETTEKDIKKGMEFASEISQITNIPIAFHAIMKSETSKKSFAVNEPVFWMDKYMGTEDILSVKATNFKKQKAIPSGYGWNNLS